MEVGGNQEGVWLDIIGPRSILTENIVVQSEVDRTWSELFLGMGRNLRNSVRVTRSCPGTNTRKCAKLTDLISDFVATFRYRRPYYKVHLFDIHETRGRRGPRTMGSSAGNQTAAVIGRTRRTAVGMGTAGNFPSQPQPVTNGPSQLGRGAKNQPSGDPMDEMPTVGAAKVRKSSRPSKPTQKMSQYLEGRKPGTSFKSPNPGRDSMKDAGAKAELEKKVAPVHLKKAHVWSSKGTYGFRCKCRQEFLTNWALQLHVNLKRRQDEMEQTSGD